MMIIYLESNPNHLLKLSDNAPNTIQEPIFKFKIKSQPIGLLVCGEKDPWRSLFLSHRIWVAQMSGWYRPYLNKLSSPQIQQAIQSNPAGFSKYTPSKILGKRIVCNICRSTREGFQLILESRESTSITDPCMLDCPINLKLIFSIL